MFVLVFIEIGTELQSAKVYLEQVDAVFGQLPRFIPVKRVVFFQFVNSFVPETKQSILPIKIPRIIGKANKSPDDCFSPIILFAISTPNNPPIIVFVLKKIKK